MIDFRRPLMIAMLGAALVPGVAGAEPQRPTPPKPKQAVPRLVDRWYFGFSGGYQATANNFNNAWTFDYYAERASATASYPVKPAFMFDAGGGMHLSARFAAGASVSYYTRRDAASLTASLPYPFEYNQFRSAQGTSAGPSRQETALHLNLMYLVAPSARISVGLFGGPSVFRVRQALIETPNFVEKYPYDEVSVGTAKMGTQTRSKAGFNVGADITYALSRRVGVGVLVRFARASASFTGPDKGSVSVQAGGAQVGAGLRFRF